MLFCQLDSPNILYTHLSQALSDAANFDFKADPELAAGKY
jgi:hypothetical protein